MIKGIAHSLWQIASRFLFSVVPSTKSASWQRRLLRSLATVRAQDSNNMFVIMPMTEDYGQKTYFKSLLPYSLGV